MQFELVLQQRPWDLIICAYVDAPLATIDLLQLTLRLRPQTPVIIVGEQVPPRVAFELGRLGAQEFIDAADTHRLLASVQQMAIAKRAAPVARSPILGVAARTPAQQLMQVLTSLQDALMSISLPDRQLLFVSASFERVFGYPVETLLKDEEFYKQVVHPEDAARVEVARAAAVREGYAEVEHRVRWPNGEVRWLRRRAWLNYDADGKPVQLIDTARDITAHKRIEEKLQAADDKQRAILNSIPDLMFHIHGNGTILDFHGRETDLFIPLEAIIGKNVREFLSHSLIPAESVAQALDAIQLAATQGQARLFDYTLPDQHHYEARILPIEGRDEVILMIRDITDRKRTEVKLRESEERYRSLVESTDGIIAVFDADGATLYANAVAARPFGLTPQQMVGKAYTELFPPDIAARQLADIRAVIQHNAGQVVESPTFVGGEERWYHTSIQPVRSATGTVVAALVNATDITALKSTEVALRQSEAYLRSLVNSTTTYNLRVDMQGRISYCNDIYRRRFAWASPNLIGMDPLDVVHPEDKHKIREAVAACLGDVGAVVQCEIRKATARGDYLWTLWEFSAVTPGDGKIEEIQCVGIDITRQKQAEAALQEANQLLEQRIQERTAELQEERNLLRALIDVVPDFIYVKDLQHRIVLNNAAHARSLGKSHAREDTGEDTGEYIGKTDFDLFPPEIAAKFYADDCHVLAEEAPVINSEERAIGQDGSETWGLTTKVPLHNVRGDLIGLAGITRDITTLKANNEALRASEERYRLLAEHIRDLVAKITPDGIVTYCSPSSLALLGYLPEEMVGNNAYGYVHPEDAVVTRQILADAFATGPDSPVITQRMRHKAGHYLWVEISNHIVRDLNGSPLEMTSVLRDITERKQAEETLRVSEARYRATIAAMSEGIVVQGLDGSIQLCNSAAQRILGLTVDQMIGLTSIDPRWRAVHADGSPFPGEMHPAMVTLHTGAPQANVVMGVHKPDGTITWILINSEPLCHPVTQQVEAAIVTFADITAPKEVEAATKAALAQEKELGELKSRFVSMASHEFRTPLAVILSSAETLRIYRERMEQGQIDARLDKIRQQVMHMKDIIDDVLQLTRMQAGRVEFAPKDADLDALCRAIVEDFDAQAESHGRIVYTCAEPPVLLPHDERLLRQAIGNLTSNALKYSRPERAVYLTLTHDRAQVAIEVRDQGIGIPEEELKHLFEPFFRAANVGATSGTGLGLSIARQAVEAHQGAIRVSSSVGTGTTVVVTLPKPRPLAESRETGDESSPTT